MNANITVPAGADNAYITHAINVQLDAIAYENREKMAQAIAILNNHSKLMKLAVANHQSIPATRLYFEKVAAGASPAPIIVNWVIMPPTYGTSVNTTVSTNVSTHVNTTDVDRDDDDEA